MKLVLTGDWHIRAKPTEYRVNKYYQQQLDKLKWIMDFANSEAEGIIIQPGDFFDTPNPSDAVAEDLVDIQGKNKIWAIFGQHDCRYRTKEATKLSLLMKTGIITKLSSTPIVMDGISIYGASFGSKILAPKNKNTYNILVIHKMVIKDKKLFGDQTDFITAADLSNKCKDYKLVVCGDNHKSFSYIPKKGAKILNCGSLMRMNTLQYKHKPNIWLVDTETDRLSQYFIPVEPTVEVFKQEAEDIRERNTKLEAYIKNLNNAKTGVKLSFKDNVESLVRGLGENIEKLAYEFIDSYEE